MKMNRRDLLFASGLSLLAGTRAFGQVVAPAAAQPARSPSEQLLSALQRNRLSLAMGDAVPAGPGWD